MAAISNDQAEKKLARGAAFKALRSHVGWKRYENYLRTLYNGILDQFSAVTDPVDLARLAAQKQLLEGIANYVKFEIASAEALEKALPNGVPTSDGDDEY